MAVWMTDADSRTIPVIAHDVWELFAMQLFDWDSLVQYIGL